MTKDEFKNIVKAINTVWAEAIQDQTAFDLWFRLLSDLDYQAASLATQKYMLTGKFPPKPADIREGVAAMAPDGGELTPQEAWGMVYRAICRSTYYSEEEFEKLPRDVQRACGSASRLRELAMDSNFNEGVESSNFMRTFSELQKKGKEIRVLPEALRLAMEEAKMIGEANGKDLCGMRKGVSGQEPSKMLQ